MSFVKQALLCAVLAVAAIAGWYAYENPNMVGLARETAAGEGRAGAGGPGNRIPGLIADGAVNVISAVVEVDSGGDNVIAIGTAKAARSVTIYPQVAGMVSEILFTPGAPVESGAVLVRLEDDEESVAVDRARVALEQARETHARSKTLAQSRTISSVALSDAETAARLAEIEVRAAEIALKRRAIAAPFAGVTGLTDISIGDYVTTSTAVTTLDDLSTVRVGFEVPERWSGRIAEGQSIIAVAQGLPGAEFSGRITRIDNRIDETTRTLKLEAELANEGRALKAGMAITVTLRFEAGEELSVPSLAVQWDRRGSFVWRLMDGAARRAPVTILRRQSGIVTVAGEIEPGDRVVVEGVQRLREGARVNEVDETPTIVEERPGEASDEEPAMSGAATTVRTRS